MVCRVRVSSPKPLQGAREGALGPDPSSPELWQGWDCRGNRSPRGKSWPWAAGLGLKAPLGEEGTWAGGEPVSLGL